ncbi:MAG: hypothetical protein NVSMB3_00800 [Acidobacteriaceae bacterium]
MEARVSAETVGDVGAWAREAERGRRVRAERRRQGRARVEVTPCYSKGSSMAWILE